MPTIMRRNMFHLCFGGISSTLSSSKSGGTCSTSTSDRNGTFWCFQNVIPFSNHQFSRKIKLFCIENRIQWSKRQILIDSGTCSTFAFSKNFGTCSTWWNEFHFTLKNMNSYKRVGFCWVFFLIVIKFEHRKEYSDSLNKDCSWVCFVTDSSRDFVLYPTSRRRWARSFGSWNDRRPMRFPEKKTFVHN